MRALATNALATHWAGLLLGLETLGMSGTTNGGLGMQIGVDSLSEFPDQRLAFGAGAKIGIDLGLPEVQALARATVHLDLGRRLHNRGACASYRLAGHEVEHKCEMVSP